jgi:hypothetical protein
LPFYSFVRDTQIGQNVQDQNEIYIFLNCRSASVARHLVAGSLQKNQTFLLTQLKSIFDQRLFNSGRKSRALVSAEFKPFKLYTVAELPGVLPAAESISIGAHASNYLPKMSLADAFKVADQSILAHEFGHFLYRTNHEYADSMRRWIVSQTEKFLQEFDRQLQLRIPDLNLAFVNDMARAMAVGQKITISDLPTQFEASETIARPHTIPGNELAAF